MAARLTQQVSDAFLPDPPKRLGVAVSGGGDSMALLHLLHGFCALHGCTLHAVTVNHGLRDQAAAEASMVADACAKLGVRHNTLFWDKWDGIGNLQSVARKARYDLMTAWAEEHDLGTVALGHTADDQAETFLMHLARRSGVNGLAGMKRRKLRDGITWVRPLLAASRQSLREYLEAAGVAWVEDASNQDMRFERIKARQVLGVLGDLGIDSDTLSEVALNMAEARKALDWQTFLAARDMVEVDAGAVVICDRKMRTLPDEIQRRLLIQALGWISGGAYPPRRAALAELMRSLKKGMAATVDGCHARRVRGHIWIFRELNAVKDMQATPDTLWDQRWRLMPPEGSVPEGVDLKALTVRALGDEGLEQCPDWRSSGRPHAVLLSTPAVWEGDRVVAAPLAGLAQNWQAQVDGGEETFFAALLSH